MRRGRVRGLGSRGTWRGLESSSRRRVDATAPERAVGVDAERGANGFEEPPGADASARLMPWCHRFFDVAFGVIGPKDERLVAVPELLGRRALGDRAERRELAAAGAGAGAPSPLGRRLLRVGVRSQPQLPRRDDGLRSRPNGGRYGSAEAERGRRGVGLRSRLTNDWWAATETPLNAVCGAGASTRSSPTHMWRAWTPRASTNRFCSPCPSRPWSGGGSSRAADAAREA